MLRWIRVGGSLVVGFAVLAGVCGGLVLAFVTPRAVAVAGAAPLRVVEDRVVVVGPGIVELGGRRILIEEEVRLRVPPVAPVAVVEERHEFLPVWNGEAIGWLRGAALHRVRADECTVGGHFDPASVVVRTAPGEPALRRGEDYRLDPYWGAIGRLPGGALAEGQAVHASYTWLPDRWDRIVWHPRRGVRLVSGEPGVGRMTPPQPAADEVAIGAGFEGAGDARLAARHLFPIAPRPEPGRDAASAARMDGFLGKLAAGEAVTIVCWGDSVTHAGFLGPDFESLRYPDRLAARLRAAWPEAEIRVEVAAWPGQTSPASFAAPPGGYFDFARDVLAHEPDLVIHMFVNDCGIPAKEVAEVYAPFAAAIREAGAELCFLAPHFVRPGWQGMDVDDLHVDEDPRPYIAALEEYADAEGCAFVDTTRSWCGLWRRGIPYTTWLVNAVNHPDERGQALFVEALMAALGGSEG